MAKKITFIGAGSTIFMKNIVGDALHYPALSDAQIALMDIDQTRLDESALVARKMISSMNVDAKVTTYTDQRAALKGADFVIVAFQIGGYEPCTVTDFDIPKNTGYARLSRILWGLAVLCVGCGLCHTCGKYATTCSRFARMH